MRKYTPESNWFAPDMDELERVEARRLIAQIQAQAADQDTTQLLAEAGETLATLQQEAPAVAGSRDLDELAERVADVEFVTERIDAQIAGLGLH